MIARSRAFAAALGVALACFAALSFAEGGPNTTLQASYVLWPDGMATTDSLPPSTGLGNEGTPQWFRFGAGARRSYSVEIFQLREDGYNSPAQATLSQAFSDLAGSVAVPFTDYSYVDPSGGDYTPASIRRYSIRDLAAGKPVFLKVVSGLNYETSATQTFRIRVFDTTLVGTRVSTVGYDAFVMLHNSGDYQVSASVHFYDEAGTFIGTQTRAINARGSVQLRYAHDDPTYGNLKGSVEVTHDGAPGSVVGHLYSYSFGLSQPGPQIPLLDSRSWGRGAY